MQHLCGTVLHCPRLLPQRPSPALLKKLDGYSDAQYVAKAKQRGQQVMRAMNADFRGIKFFCLYGPSVTAQYAADPHAYYHLYAPFLEGMAVVATPRSQICCS